MENVFSLTYSVNTLNLMKKIFSILFSTVAITNMSFAADNTTKMQLADAHFHSSNYAMQGISLKNFIDDYLLKSNGLIFRSTIMPIPLQQRWGSFEQYEATKIDQNNLVAYLYGPNYYIGTKTDLYYSSFVDAMYAKEFLSLPKNYQEKLDLMMTTLNPMDMYAAQQVKRAILTFPGAFVGIGEFTIHKEIVSNKIAGEPIKYTISSDVQFPPDVKVNGKVSLYAKSLEYLLKTASDIGLIVNIHNDIYPAIVDYNGNLISLHPSESYVNGLIHLCSKSSNAKVIWSHTGLGRYVKPYKEHLTEVSKVLDKCPNWNVDISWDIVQKYIVSPGSEMPTQDEWKQFMIKYQDRILWGSDSVIYTRNKFEKNGQKYSVTPGGLMSLDNYMSDALLLGDFLNSLPNDVSEKIRYKNYIKLFDSAKSNVRSWESKHANDNVWDIPTVDFIQPR